MATINVLLNESRADRNGLYPILIKVRNGKEKKEIAVGYRIDKKYWLESEQRVSKKHPDAALINSAIESKRSELARAIHDAELQDRQVRVKSLGNKRPQSLFTNYLKYRADDYKARGKNVMHRKVITFYRELLECFTEGTYFDDIDMDWMRRLDAWLIEKGNVANTRARKFKFFRGFFQNAIDEGETEGGNFGGIDHVITS